MTAASKNIVASVLARLRNVAESGGLSFNDILQSYVIERFLARLARSSYAGGVLLEPVLKHLRDPKMVALMVKHMQERFAKQVRESNATAHAVPEALAKLDQRLVKLRARLAQGDPDMTTDELQGVIEGVEAKRNELKSKQPEQKQHARVLALLPKAAKAYAEQLEAGIDGDPRAVQRARLILRDLIGKITYEPRATGLWAMYRLNPGVLVSGPHAGNRIRGRGEGVCTIPAVPYRVCVKPAKPR